VTYLRNVLIQDGILAEGQSAKSKRGIRVIKNVDTMRLKDQYFGDEIMRSALEMPCINGTCMDDEVENGSQLDIFNSSPQQGTQETLVIGTQATVAAESQG
jgi:hypothetical protein